MSTETNDRRGWAEILKSEYEQGADDVEVCSAIGLSRKDFDNYYQNNETFKELVDLGRLASAAWWRSIARKNMFNKSFNTNVWSFTMKNRFGWAEKSETTQVDVPLNQKSEEELRSELLAKAPELLKMVGGVDKLATLAVLPDEKDTNKH